MSALFDFNSFLTVVLLFICSCTYYKLINPSGLTQKTGWVDHGCFCPASPSRARAFALGFNSPAPSPPQKTHSFRGLFWKAARIGERLSPWVSIACVAMGVCTLLY